MTMPRLVVGALAFTLILGACSATSTETSTSEGAGAQAQQVAATQTQPPATTTTTTTTTAPTTTTTAATTTTTKPPVLAIGGASPYRLVAFEHNPILEKPSDKGGAMLPEVRLVDGTFHMWFTQSADWTAVPEAIYHATSKDGFTWKVDEEPALTGDGDGFDAFAVAEARVIQADDGTWVMFYNALAEPRPGPGAAIGRAVADTPEGPWRRDPEPFLVTGEPGSWDSGLVTPASVVRHDGRILLYYSGGIDMTKPGSHMRVGLVVIDGDAVTRRPEPVFAENAGWDAGWAWEPAVFADGDGLGAFFAGLPDKPTEAIGYASSSDGVSWTEASDNPLLEPGDPWSQTWVVPSSVVDFPDGRRMLYYSGNNSVQLPLYSIGVAEIVPAD